MILEASTTRAEYRGDFAETAPALRFLRFLRREKAEAVAVDGCRVSVDAAISRLSKPEPDPRQLELF